MKHVVVQAVLSALRVQIILIDLLIMDLVYAIQVSMIPISKFVVHVIIPVMNVMDP